ncbi:MAG TPA: AAA family ATPase [Candidatus Pacebacteria bacterium]|nr:AAA family ATPase [Candidatus Paceibacterota bacterium]
MNKKIIGHKENIELLKKAMQNGGFHHSFLFTGPENIGKQVVARALADGVVNDNMEGTLQLCHRIDSDVHIVIPERIEKKKKIIIKDIEMEVITDAIHSMALAPDKKAKVLIIDDAHRMTFAAQNALLKTLEEPRNNRYVILVTHSAGRLLQTIQSRCFVVQFGTVDIKELRDVYGESEYLDDVSGRPGFLHQIHSNKEFRETVEHARHELQTLAQKKIYERLELALELSKKDDAYLQTFFHVWIYRIRAAAYKTKKFQLIKVADRVEGVLDRMDSTNVNKQLILENLLINIV